ncbi:hypothetical protein EVAR_20789_1 [Eumeta japonica]|uniref:Uncharacterized protein n=1 Tax=Eumeta variegata TaxID=151549 RepID=A0A4C1UDE3_EUMVA|nr:hypothetical protein EVAR_20789_1 [Eumeta japonica]
MRNSLLTDRPTDIQMDSGGVRFRYKASPNSRSRPHGTELFAFFSAFKPSGWLFLRSGVGGAGRARASAGARGRAGARGGGPHTQAARNAELIAAPYCTKGTRRGPWGSPFAPTSFHKVRPPPVGMPPTPSGSPCLPRGARPNCQPCGGQNWGNASGAHAGI